MGESYALIIDRRELHRTWFKLIPALIFDWCVPVEFDHIPNYISSYIIVTVLDLKPWDRKGQLPFDTAESVQGLYTSLHTVITCGGNTTMHKMASMPTKSHLYYTSIHDIIEKGYEIDERRIYVIQ